MNTPMSKAHKLVYTTTMPIRWGDMDAMGHVNNTVYFRYLEQARVEWFAHLGYPINAKQEAPVIINASCTFLMPLTYPGNIVVRMYLGRAGNSSVESYYEILRDDDGDDKVAAEGAAKIVWFNPQTGKSAPLPAQVRALSSND